jgi:hypothetical protein
MPCWLSQVQSTGAWHHPVSYRSYPVSKECRNIETFLLVVFFKRAGPFFCFLRLTKFLDMSSMSKDFLWGLPPRRPGHTKEKAVCLKRKKMPDPYLICVTVGFFLSEFLPFVRNTHANGLMHAIQLLATHALQVFSPGGAPVQAPAPAPVPAPAPAPEPVRDTRARHPHGKHARHSGKRRKHPRGSPCTGKAQSADSVHPRCNGRRSDT